jgi:uncharacterized membrane protein YgcG
VNVPASAAPETSNSYKINLTVADVSGTPSQAISLPLTVIQDFQIGSLTPATQTVTAGQSASYNFSVLPVGVEFAGAVNLSCSGAPAPCTFKPSSVTPGNNSAAVVLTINTIASSASNAPLWRHGGTAVINATCLYAAWIVLPALAISQMRWRRKQYRPRRRAIASLFASLMLVLLVNSCGVGGSNGGGGDGGEGGGGGGAGQQEGTLPGSYTITVAGTSGALSHQSPAVTLIVKAE